MIDLENNSKFRHPAPDKGYGWFSENDLAHFCGMGVPPMVNIKKTRARCPCYVKEKHPVIFRRGNKKSEFILKNDNNPLLVQELNKSFFVKIF